MVLELPTASRNAACDAVVDRCEGGTPPALIRVYTGTKPGANNAATGTLLAQFTCSNPAFTAAVTGTATLDITPALTATGLANGTAGWFRIVTGATIATVIDGTVTVTGGGGDLELNTLSVTTSIPVEITGGTVTMGVGG
jgi:hypothetical protein